MNTLIERHTDMAGTAVMSRASRPWSTAVAAAKPYAAMSGIGFGCVNHQLRSPREASM